MQIAAVYNRTTLWLVLLGMVVYWFQQRKSASNNILMRKDEQSPAVLVAPHQQKNGTRFFYNAQARKYNDMPRWMDRFPFLPAVEDVPDDSRICFVHVGKTAGSTMGCYLGFKYNDCHDRMRVLPGNLPLYTTNVVHTHFDTCQRERIALYLITLRDPVARMQSWFTYERPSSVYARDYGYKKPLFVDCNFNTMDELGGSRGLGGMGRNPCSKMAWWAVQGIVGFKVRTSEAHCTAGVSLDSKRSSLVGMRTYGIHSLTHFRTHTQTQYRVTIAIILRITITATYRTTILPELQRSARNISNKTGSASKNACSARRPTTPPLPRGSDAKTHRRRTIKTITCRTSR